MCVFWVRWTSIKPQAGQAYQQHPTVPFPKETHSRDRAIKIKKWEGLVSAAILNAAIIVHHATPSKPHESKDVEMKINIYSWHITRNPEIKNQLMLEDSDIFLPSSS